MNTSDFNTHKRVTEQNNAKLLETNKEVGNNIDPLMGTCFGSFHRQAMVDIKTYKRILLAEQDGADFYLAEPNISAHKIARYEYPFRKCGDWYSFEAAQEAAAMFLRDNPEYRLLSLDQP
jgi:hypothetical protein